ncbi:TetR/AcrR family transcriptional regulator [Pseudomonas solani]
MSKRPVIDRNLVLDAAISVVMDQGISALSIGEVAKAAGISKGGVQSCFGTKDGLVEAMVNRWKADYEASVMARLAPDAGVLELLTAQIHIIAIPDEELSKRAAAILTAMFSQDSLRAQAEARQACAPRPTTGTVPCCWAERSKASAASVCGWPFSRPPGPSSCAPSASWKSRKRSGKPSTRTSPGCCPPTPPRPR